MKQETQSALLNAFISWGEKLRTKHGHEVKIEIEVGPPYVKQGVSINFNDKREIGTISVWNSAEYEIYFQSIYGDEVSNFHYGEAIEPEQFEQLFSPVTFRYFNRPRS